MNKSTCTRWCAHYTIWYCFTWTTFTELKLFFKLTHFSLKSSL